MPVQEEDQMEPEPHYEDFRSLRRKIFDWEGALLQQCTTAAAHWLLSVVCQQPTAQLKIHSINSILKTAGACRMQTDHTEVLPQCWRSKQPTHGVEPISLL
jgi:hypothetical protein